MPVAPASSKGGAEAPDSRRLCTGGFVNLLRLKLSSNARIVYPGPSYPLSSPLRARDCGPALESLPHLLPVVRRRQQMSSRSEVLGDWTIGRQEALRMPRRLQPLHAIFSLACGAMRVLTAVIEVATLPMFHPGQELALRRAVALELIRDDHPWHVLQPLEQLAKALLGRLLVAPLLDEDVQDVVVLIHRAPQVMALTVNRQKHFIQMPCIARLRATATQPIGVILPKLPAPFADGFVGHSDTTFEQEFLHVAIAQVMYPNPADNSIGPK